MLLLTKPCDRKEAKLARCSGIDMVFAEGLPCSLPRSEGVMSPFISCITFLDCRCVDHPIDDAPRMAEVVASGDAGARIAMMGRDGGRGGEWSCRIDRW
jgi:hypothetical protein